MKAREQWGHVQVATVDESPLGSQLQPTAVAAEGPGCRQYLDRWEKLYQDEMREDQIPMYTDRTQKLS